MRFRLILTRADNANVIPINLQYPLSAVIYKIIAEADSAYATFLHDTGYKQRHSLKSFKLFTFSDLKTPFNINGDRLVLLTNKAELVVCFHLPQAAENFIKGLFLHQQFDIADRTSKARFEVQSVEAIPNPLQQYKEQEIIHISLKPLSPVVAGLPNDKGNYDFLSPEVARFADSLVYNWRSKIAACYDDATASAALLMAAVKPTSRPPKSRLITIKSGTPAETKIKGWTGFELKVTGEKRFVELLLNAGSGVYNSVGMGCVGV
ncbi:MAG: CRISPR-associated endoribonuclease Cas6 [Agriterribacter sp.]